MLSVEKLKELGYVTLDEACAKIGCKSGGNVPERLRQHKVDTLLVPLGGEKGRVRTFVNLASLMASSLCQSTSDNPRPAVVGGGNNGGYLKEGQRLLRERVDNLELRLGKLESELGVKE